MNTEHRLDIDLHVKYIQKLDTVRLPSPSLHIRSFIDSIPVRYEIDHDREKMTWLTTSLNTSESMASTGDS